MSAAPTKAMVLAAGLGTRIRPLTQSLPKPLVKVGGRTLIDRALDRLHDAGVASAVVNLHHLAPLIESHLHARNAPRIAFSREETLLETGGGIAKALPLLGPAPFFGVNSDVIWLNGPTGALARLAQRWDDAEMDALLLLHATVSAYGYRGVGDFQSDPSGQLARRKETEVAPFLFTGVQILHPRLFEAAPDGAFSLNVLYDQALAKQRLYGVVHDGEWFHVGDSDGLAEAETFLRFRYAGRERR